MQNKNKNKQFILIQRLNLQTVLGVALLALFLVQGNLPAWAQVDFNALSLTPAQQSTINQYENEWRRTYTQLQPQVVKDRAKLRQLINDPNASEGQVMMIQSRLQENEEKLRHEATHIFMKKKKQLNPQQKQKLKQMMGR